MMIVVITTKKAMIMTMRMNNSYLRKEREKW